MGLFDNKCYDADLNDFAGGSSNPEDPNRPLVS
jgi:hypothetical protein